MAIQGPGLHGLPRPAASQRRGGIRHCEERSDEVGSVIARSAATWQSRAPGFMDCHGLRPRSDEVGSVIARSAATRQSMPYSCYQNVPMQPAVYILASKPRGTLYVGVTSDLVQRIWQHKNNLAKGFTQEYCVHVLVYFELHSTMLNAIAREKQLKAGSRAKKLALIESMNSSWSDLYPGLL